MISSAASLSVRRPPRVRVAPRAGKTYGDLAAALASDYGLVPDDWQRLILDDWLALSRGRWAALTCGLALPRQNGKNAVVEVREVFGMVGLGERILHTAHEVKTAQQHFRRLMHFFGTQANDPAANFPELNALVSSVRRVNGQEAIHLRNGGSVELVARSKNSGRGFTVDVLVMDEAQELSEEALEALMPTTSAAPKRNPQWILTGTPPGPNAAGEVFARTRAQGLAGSSERLAWAEWSVPADADLDDRRNWYAANPALGTRLQLEVIEGERERFSDAGFARERLGVWDDVATVQVIGADTWGRCADEASRPAGRLALAVDVAPDRSTAAVALAGQRADGGWHVELDEHRSGVGWLVEYVAARCERNSIRAVVIDGASPAASAIDEFAARRVKVTTTGPRDMAQACGRFYDGTQEGWLRHIDQPQLNVALSNARRRALGDAWAWNRRNAASDITPLVAATLALWGAQASTVKRPTRGQGRGRTAGTGRRAVVLA